jgi:hypothetical protein
MSQAATAGLRFEVYLPPGLAEWVLGFVESGAYTSPNEAVFWMLREQQDLAPHPDGSVLPMRSGNAQGYRI